MIENCENCRFSLGEAAAAPDIRVCRRYPPSVKGLWEPQILLHPIVSSSDWCGEWTEEYRRGGTRVEAPLARPQEDE